MTIQVGDRVLFTEDFGGNADSFKDVGLEVVDTDADDLWPIRILFPDGATGLCTAFEVYVFKAADEPDAAE